MADSIGVMQYWAGCPTSPNAKWRRILEVLKRCAERGWRTFLVWSAMPDDPQLSAPFAEFGCRIILQPRAKGNFDAACMLRTYRLLRSVRPAVLHCHNVHTSPLIGAALAGVPARVWSKLAMSPYYATGTKPTGYHRWAPSTRVSCRLAHRVLCRSTAVRDELVSDGAPADKLEIWPPEIDLAPYRAASGAQVRAELGLTDTEALIVTVGHAVPVKGWDILIRAFGKVADELPRARLLLVGSHTDAHEQATAADLRALVAEFGLQARVQFAGRRDDIAELLAAADVFVMPSRSEGLPSALIEAMAAGRPVIAARVGGIPDAINDGHDGLLFARGNVDELADALRRLTGDQPLREALAQQARTSAARFDLETATERTLALYEELLGRSGVLPPPTA